MRRFEILVPIPPGDGRGPDRRVVGVLRELQQRFGAVSSETQVIQGLWRQGQRVDRDEVARLFVDVADTPDNLDYFRGLKRRLESAFVQEAIWVTTHSVEVL